MLISNYITPVMYVDPSGKFTLPNWAKWLIGGVAFTGAVVLTCLSGGALAPVFIGMGLSIVLGGTIEGTMSVANGDSFWEGFFNRAADGAMWGGIFALGISTGSYIKYLRLIQSRGAVIGKGMSRVGFAADQAALSKYTPMKGYNYIKGSGTAKWHVALADNLSIAHNKSWINRVMRLKKPIYDIGFGAIIEAGPWYSFDSGRVVKYAKYLIF